MNLQSEKIPGRAAFVRVGRRTIQCERRRAGIHRCRDQKCKASGLVTVSEAELVFKFGPATSSYLQIGTYHNVPCPGTEKYKHETRSRGHLPSQKHAHE